MTGDVAGLPGLPSVRKGALLAAACLELVEAHKVGLIAGAHPIDTERCHEILADAAEHGVQITTTQAQAASIELIKVLAARDIAQEATK